MRISDWSSDVCSSDLRSAVTALDCFASLAMTGRWFQLGRRNMTGPLTGIRIIEFAGIGPGPFCGMMLADHGAEVISIDRPGGFMDPRDPLSRGRTPIALAMKKPDAVQVARALCRSADGIIEGYRPGGVERRRTEEGRVGKEWVRTGGYRGEP